MTEAEKLILIAENERKVYEAGRQKMVDLHPKVTVSGNYISVDDVSELPHSVACKVESANLWRGNNEYSVVGNGTVQAIYQDFSLKGTSCAMSFSCEVTSENLEYTENGNFVYLHIMYEDGTANIFTLCSNNTTSGNAVKQINADGAKVIKQISVFAHNRFTGGMVTLSNIMLNKGTIALPYTPYVEPETVKVTRAGKNLFDVGTVENYVGLIDGLSVSNGSFSATVIKSNGRYFVNTKNRYTSGEYVISYECSDIKRVILRLYDENGNIMETCPNLKPVGFGFNTIYKGFFHNLTDGIVNIPKAVAYWNLGFIMPETETAPAGTVVEISNIQVEYGKFASDYEPYNGQTFTPATDGKVEGMTSVSPYMNIFTDNAGATLEATYRKSAGFDVGKQAEYDRFWDEFQQNGNRTNYAVAFGSGWNTNNFKPKYSLRPTNAYMMFFTNLGGFIEIGKVAEDYFDELGIELDYSNATNAMYGIAILHAKRFKKLNFSSATNTQYLFYSHNNPNTYSVEEIDEFVSSATTTYHSTTFEGGTFLREIRFTGVIAKSIYFQKCQLLTAESFVSVVEHLSDTTTGLTATFNKSAKEAAFTDDEWAALIATKSNWTFSLI